ncbi:beta-lactamase-like protein [Zopfochytrium polystomum]|nr:beta-lactamase-like protein [Zopfochytrium polystomum]
MRYFLQILGSATVDSRPSVVVHFDSQRYLFNCFEGTQRFCNDRKIRLAGGKKSMFFFTRVSWDCIGGLPGMLLTLADAGTKLFKIHGPANITRALAATRQFLFRSDITVDTHEFPENGEEVSDENLTIRPVLLRRLASPTIAGTSTTKPNLLAPRYPAMSAKEARRILKSMFPTSGSNSGPANSANQLKRSLNSDEVVHPLSDRTKRVCTPGGCSPSAAESDNVPATEPAATSTSNEPSEARERITLAYVCTGPTVPGRLDPVKAANLGVPRGPDLGRLTRGESVTLNDGRVIQPHECVGPSKPGQIFLILDVPDRDFVASLVNNQSLSAEFLQKDGNPVSCIVHMLGNGVIGVPAYVNWIKQFPKETKHIVAGQNFSPDELVLLCTANIQHQLNMLDEDVFLRPYEDNSLKATEIPPNTTLSQPLTLVQFEPKLLVDVSQTVRFRPPSPNTPSLRSYLAVAAPVKDKIKASKWGRERSPQSPTRSPRSSQSKRPLRDYGVPSGVTFGGGDTKEVIVIPFGTGSAIPSKYRNVSSTFASFSNGSVLMDTGEGTLGQMFRHFGPELLDQHLLNLRLIFISHMHADHHLGLISILKRISELRREKQGDDQLPPLCVVGPTKLHQWLEDYAAVEDFGIDEIDLFDSKFLTGRTPNSPIDPRLAKMWSNIVAVPVVHCYQSYAVVLKHTSGTQIAFSGDCRPSNAFADVGRGSDLVIHEATFNDDMQEEANSKRHSTTSEAISVAKQMQAKNLLLTHFSQRYPKLPSAQKSVVEGPGGRLVIGAAFDSMRIRLSEFDKLPLLMGPLQALWGQLEDE